MFKQPWPRGSAHVYFGKYQRGQSPLKVEKKVKSIALYNESHWSSASLTKKEPNVPLLKENQS